MRDKENQRQKGIQPSENAFWLECTGPYVLYVQYVCVGQADLIGKGTKRLENKEEGDVRRPVERGKRE